MWACPGSLWSLSRSTPRAENGTERALIRCKNLAHTTYIQTQRLSACARAVSSAAQTDSTRSHIQVHARVLYGESQTASEGHFGFWHFFSAPAAPVTGSKTQSYKHMHAGCRRSGTGSSVRGRWRVVRALSVAPCLDDELEEEEVGSKGAAHRTIAARGSVSGCERDAVPLLARRSQPLRAT